MGYWVFASRYKVYNKIPISSQFVSKPDMKKGEREHILCQYCTEDRKKNNGIIFAN